MCVPVLTLLPTGFAQAYLACNIASLDGEKQIKITSACSLPLACTVPHNKMGRLTFATPHHTFEGQARGLNVVYGFACMPMPIHKSVFCVQAFFFVSPGPLNYTVHMIGRSSVTSGAQMGDFGRILGLLHLEFVPWKLA